MSEKDRLSPGAYQNKIEYNVERNRQLKKDKIIKTFSCDLDYNYLMEINKFLQKHGYTKKDIVNAGYDKLKNTK